jgi:hypothetical protein
MSRIGVNIENDLGLAASYFSRDGGEFSSSRP